MFGLVNNVNNINISQTPEVIIEPSTPWVAAADGDLALLEKSLETLQIPFMTPDENGFTILHSAAAYNQLHILNWIFLKTKEQQQSQSANGVIMNVNVQDSDGDTPLHHCDNVEAAKILITVGNANISITNKEGKTALQLKEEEWEEGLEEDGNDDDDDEDRMNLKALINYLKGLGAGEEDGNSNMAI